MIVGLLLADAMRSFDIGATLEVFAYDRTMPPAGSGPQRG
jgi:hypothetical protein